MGNVETSMQNPRLNETAQQLVEKLVENADALKIAVLDDGVNVPVIDCGIKAPGSVAAGLALAEICMAGQGNATLVAGDRTIWPGGAIMVQTDQPLLACMASQYAGWQVKSGKFFAMASGPMRALAGKEELYESIGCRESAAVAVGALETRQFPPPALCRQLASECFVEHRKLSLLVAPTGSIAGTVQVVARSVETVLHKLHELGFDLNKVRSGWGVAPLPPIAADDLVGIGRTNDAILYGGQVELWVEADDTELADIVPRVPSSASKDHGKPFREIFENYDHNFYDIDPHLFSPAWVRVNNLSSGRSYTAGEVLPEVLRSSFESITQ